MAAGFASLVEMGKRGGVVLQQLDELRVGALKAEGGLVGVEFAGLDDVEGFGEEGGVVTVGWIAGDAALGAGSGHPEVGTGVTQWDGPADLRREREAKTEYGDGLVLLGAAALARVGFDAGWCVVKGDLGFDLVAVLATGAGGAALGEVALLEELGVGKGGGVHEAETVRRGAEGNRRGRGRDVTLPDRGFDRRPLESSLRTLRDLCAPAYLPQHDVVGVA